MIIALLYTFSLVLGDFNYYSQFVNNPLGFRWKQCLYKTINRARNEIKSNTASIKHLNVFTSHRAVYVCINGSSVFKY